MKASMAWAINVSKNSTILQKRIFNRIHKESLFDNSYTFFIGGPRQ